MTREACSASPAIGRRLALAFPLGLLTLFAAGSVQGAGPKAAVHSSVREVRRFENDDGISGLALSNDGSMIAVTTWNIERQLGHVHVLSVAAGKREKNTLPNTGASSPMVKFSEDGTRLYYVSQDPGKPTVFGAFHYKTGRSTPIATFSLLKPPRPPHVAKWALSADGSTAMFSQSPVPRSQLPAQARDDPNSAIAVTIWDLKKKRELSYAVEEAYEISAIALSSDGTIAAVALRSAREETPNFKENIRIWDVRTKEVLYSAKFDKINRTVPAIAFADGDKKLVAVSPHWGQFDVIDVVTRELTTTSVKGWEGNNATTIFVPGTTVALSGMFYGGEERGFRLTDWAKGEIIEQVEGEDIVGDSRAATPDGKRIATGGRGRPVIVWDLKRP